MPTIGPWEGNQPFASLTMKAHSNRRQLAPKLTGDPATDQSLLELAEVLAEIAKKMMCPTTERRKKDDD